MAVKVRCSGCDKVLTAPDEARGKAIKCPHCETRVGVPAGSTKPAKKPAKEARAADSESALATLDLRDVEDDEARICPKCGYDMVHQDEDETECPKCGFDSATGGQGERARKRSMRGPDPDKYYESLWGPSWSFVIKNQVLAWRTMAYVTVSSLLLFLSVFLYLYIPPWPPRAFFALCGSVAGLMIPGWLWFLDETVVVATLSRKDKLSRVNFDFALCSALGVKGLIWHVAIGLPIMLVPLLAIYFLSSSLPGIVLFLIGFLAYLPVLGMLPIGMGHMVMPVTAPAYMIWKVFPAWMKTFKASMVFLLLLFAVNIPALACLGVIAGVYGTDLVQFVDDMEENAAIWREKKARESAPKKKDAVQVVEDKPLREVKYSVLIVPSILWFVGGLFIAFPALYACRLNGLFVYYMRDYLDMIALAKEYKYVSKPKIDPDDIKPKTDSQVFVDAFVIFLIAMIVSIVFGLLNGALSNDGDILLGMIGGAIFGLRLGYLFGAWMLTQSAWDEHPGWGVLVGLFPFGLGLGIVCGFVLLFVDIFALKIVAGVGGGFALLGVIGALVFTAKHWKEARTGCFVCLISIVASMMFTVLALIGVISFVALTGINQADPNAVPPAAVAPGDPAAMPAAPVDPAAHAQPAP